MNPNWINQRTLVLERDNQACVGCGAKTDLHVHHLNPRYSGGGDEPNNLITLCAACHAERHMTLQTKLSRRFIERWAHQIARWVDFGKVLPMEKINFGPVLRLFNVDRFRPGQLEIVLAALRGESILYISPTGSGKSLCFQIPALFRPNVELVFSPLKTLMLDQTRKLQELKIPATFINGDLSREEKEIRLTLLEKNLVKFIYVAPEAFGDRADPQRLSRLKKIRPSYLVLDEAHAKPKWEKAFRTDYSRIEKIREEFNNPPILAFTATAGIETRKKIISNLGIKKVSIFVQDVDRPNIYLSKLCEDDDQLRVAVMLDLIRYSKNLSGKTMIFVPTVREGSMVAELFAANGHQVPFYHGKLPMLERDSMLNRFIGEHKPVQDVIICTNAFGMGMDIPNVRTVIHWQYPASIEDYVQEYGRAGRDGKEALALLFYRTFDDKDYGLQKYMIEKTLENSELDKSSRATEYDFSIGRLQEMKNYAHSEDCLRKQISRYFDDDKTKKDFNISKFILNFVFTTKSRKKSKYKCCISCDGILYRKLA